MTMQVGMVASDGRIVLASDTKWTHPPKDISSSAKRYTSTREKIHIDHKRGIAICMAGDMQTAECIAKLIIQEWKSEDSKYPEDALERIGHNVPEQDRQWTQCHIVLAGSVPRLFTFEFCEFGEGRVPSCVEEKSKFIAGDAANAAVFWAERYYQKSLSVDQLIPLAAHLIASAARINNGGIGGLDIVLCDSSYHRLSEDSIKKLEQRAEWLDKQIGELIFDPSALR